MKISYGDTDPQLLRVFDKGTGVSEDLSGLVAVLDVSEGELSDPVFSVQGNLLPEPGLVSFSFSRQQSSRSGWYWYRVKLIDSDGRQLTVKRGRVQFV